MTETKKICVTGGAGFIGSHLVEALVRDGHSVTVIDDFSMGRPENLQTVDDSISLIRRSIMDLPALRESLKGVDLVFHLAALLGIQRVYDRPLEIIDSSVQGTRNVFQACVERGVSRVVYTSSSEVYGDSESIPYSEDDYVSPISCYAVSKLLGEKIAEA
ncbi:MAG: NAD-dependent epimerase/dehydratase family protein, partial [Thermoplasmata archaeon]|nr:NAD-dependent epimerase/dehydratase family protein [Thermoplasmata archaeon]